MQSSVMVRKSWKNAPVKVFPPRMSDGCLLLPVCKGQRDKREIVGWAKVDDCEYSRNVLAGYSWHFATAGHVCTKLTRNNTTFLHSLVFSRSHGTCKSGYEVDHRDRDKTNNTSSNLFAVRRSINSANKDKQRGEWTSRFKGVCRVFQGGYEMWRASVEKDGRHVLRKYFGKRRGGELAAARAVNAAYREHYPELSIPNPEAEVINLGENHGLNA